MNTIIETLKAILAVIGISVLLLNPSFIAAATKGGHAHQPKLAIRKAPAPVPPPNQAKPQKTVNRPKLKIKLPGKDGSANIDKRRTAVKPPVKQKDKRLVNRPQKSKPDLRQRKTDKAPVNQKDKRLVSRQQNPKPDPRQRKTDKAPVNQKDKRLANKQPNLAGEKSRRSNNLHSPRTIAGTASRGKSTGEQSVHDSRSVSKNGVTNRDKNALRKSVGRKAATRQQRDMPKHVDVPRTLGGAAQTARPDTRINKVGDRFGKPAIVVAQPNPAQVIGETGKRNIDRSSEKGPATSTGPRLNPEAASQTNPIHQQSWKSRKNVKLRQESLVRTSNIPDSAIHGWLATMAEVPADESDSRGKLEAGQFDLQGSTHDPEASQGIAGQIETGGQLDRDKSTDLAKDLKEIIGMEHQNIGHGANAKELQNQGGNSFGKAKSPGTYVGDRVSPSSSRPGGFPDPTAQAMAILDKERPRGGNPSSSGSAGSSETDDQWEDATGSDDGSKIEIDSIDVEVDVPGYSEETKTAVKDIIGNYHTGAVLGVISHVSPAAGIWLGAVGIPLVLADLEYGGGDGYSVGLNKFKYRWMPNPDDSEDPARGENPEAALAAWKARLGWLTQPAGDEPARVYGEIDPDAPKEIAKQRRDWAINWGNGENESEGGGNGMLPHEKLGPDPIEGPSFGSETGIENQ